MDRRYLLVAALLATVDAGAATFNKCVDESGHVTFTQAACPGGLTGESITVHRGGAGMSLGPAPTPVVTEQAAPEAEASGQVNVVGGWFRLRWWL